MKKNKRILCLLLALCLCASLGLPALAEESTEAVPENTASTPDGGNETDPDADTPEGGDTSPDADAPESGTDTDPDADIPEGGTDTGPDAEIPDTGSDADAPDGDGDADPGAEPGTLYDLWICGVQVTDANRDDILGTADEGAVFTFDGHTLTVQGDCTAPADSALIESRLAGGLTVAAAADAVLQAAGGPCIRAETDLTLTGPGTLTLLGGSGGEDCALFIGGGEGSQLLTIRDVEITARAGLPVRADRNRQQLTIENASLIAQSTGESPAVSGFSGAVTITGGTVIEPAGGYTRRATSSNPANVTDHDMRPAGSVRIEPCQVFDLWLDGYRVHSKNMEDVLGNGVFRFDGDHTLTVCGDYSSNRTMIYSLLDGLVLEAEKDVRLDSSKNDFPCISIEADMTIRGEHTLTLVGGAGETTHTAAVSLDAQGLTLTLDHASLDIAGCVGLSAAKWDGRLVIDSSALTVRSEDPYPAVIGFGGGVELAGCEIIAPARAIVEEGTILNSYGGDVSLVEIGLRAWPLWVAGTQITGLNMDDVLGDGKGVFSFDGDHTLTIRGDCEFSGDVILLSRMPGLVISAAEDSVLTNGAFGCLELEADTVLTGPGALTLQAPDDGCALTLSSGAALTLDEADLTLSGRWGILGYGQETLDVYYSRLRADAPDGALYGFKAMTLRACHLTEPADGAAADSGVLDRRGDPAGTAELTPDIRVSQVSLDQEALTLAEGEDVLLTALVLPEDAAVRTVTWSTSDETVAAVEQDGRITAVGGGSAVITVTTDDGSLTAECTVTVTHTLTHREAQAPTCTEPGAMEYWICPDCGKLYADEEGFALLTEEDVLVPAKGHTPGEAARENETEPGCETEGSYDEVVYCTVCHEELSRETQTVPAGHLWGEWTVTRPATEDEEGVETRVCARDEGHTETRPLPKLAPLLGDVDRDRLVGPRDAAMVLAAPDDADPARADVNGDGAVDSTDAALILQHAAGLIQRFPAEDADEA